MAASRKSSPQGTDYMKRCWLRGFLTWTTPTWKRREKEWWCFYGPARSWAASRASRASEGNAASFPSQQKRWESRRRWCVYRSIPKPGSFPAHYSVRWNALNSFLKMYIEAHSSICPLSSALCYTAWPGSQVRTAEPGWWCARLWSCPLLSTRSLMKPLLGEILSQKVWF